MMKMPGLMILKVKSFFRMTLQTNSCSVLIAYLGSFAVENIRKDDIRVLIFDVTIDDFS